MVSWECDSPFGANIFVARTVFFYHVLRIILSEFDEDLK